MRLNGRDIVLFRRKDTAFAFDSRCPHAGGAIELGDMEDIDGTSCVTCPVHGFHFDAVSGVSVVPEGTYRLGTYPTRIEADGTVSVGFEGIDDSVFLDEDF